ncbi:hypothetical protein KC363_g5484 [Hortaea werneckii]|nr:hypothetical protein KC325_g4033 [Hortaea werneckii]KAI6994391.1 hypothetical protein KC359_g4670 [Hortaea werneckii]KAI7146153.1 hypothetical protein KC344_g3879 [Hortaea werneckii]KAI7174936.1 hypothetical protein KC360_g4020 [Hortaea werneckii]KAI7188322.1 hypothetical protein KC363_g5484 [Hortaea werneckii]
MHFSLAASSILSTLASTVLAAPASFQAPAPFKFIAAEESSNLAKRNIGGVRLCTGSAWTGWCQYVIWPLNECISLNDFAGHTLSFRPDEGTQCFLMQGRCDANNEYADVRYESLGLGHLEVLSFVANMSSYQCFEPIDS